MAANKKIVKNASPSIRRVHQMLERYPELTSNSRMKRMILRIYRMGYCEGFSKAYGRKMRLQS